MYDVIVIGGSFAGLSAALQLARARRRVLVIDGGRRRNRFASHAHGFLTQDGRPPGEIAAIGRQQLLRYPSVAWVEGDVLQAQRRGDGGFSFATGTEVYTSTSAVLALGVSDTVPGLPGLEERWGRSVFICPYCDGYELGDGPIGVIGMSPMSVHHALMLPDWGKTTFFLNGLVEPTAEELAHLARRGVKLEKTPITQIAGDHADVHLADGRVVAMKGLFTATKTSPTSDIAQQLGCEMEEGPAGPFIKTDAMKATSVPGVFACGDAARAFGNVTLAIGDGNIAGSAAHQFTIVGSLGG